MRSLTPLRTRAMSSIMVIVVCVGLAAGAGLYMREARSANCPCGISAAMVRLTGFTLTTYVQGWIAWTYILLAFNFSALNSQISGGTMVNQESESYETMVRARAAGISNSWEQSLSATESPDHKFQATLANVAGGSAATVRASSKAMAQENNNWLRGLTTLSAGTSAGNAAATFAYNSENYCTELQQEQGLCEATDPDLEGAHVKADSMFKYNVLSEKFRDASIDFCRTVVGFNKQTQLSRIATPDGAVAANNRDTRDARMALVLQTCQHLTSMREEIKDDEMAAWADTMRKLIFGIEGGVPIELSALSPDSTGTSMYEIMMFASQYRASNSEWYVHLQTMPDAKSVIKSIVAIRATMLYMRFQRYKLREYQTGLIATIQGAEANQYFDESVGNIQEARF